MEQAQLTLNQGQQAAADGFFQFLFSDEKEMIISGPGGVGKTYLMGALIDMIMPRYFDTCKMMGIDPLYHSVAMTATTNKAADVLSQAIGRPTDTVHSYFNLKVTDNFATGRSTLSKTRSWEVHQGKIIFVDECSMIDTPLRRYILEGTCNCKIVYVGDHSQLAPIMEPISPIYRDGLPMFVLTEPMRTSDPYLQALNQQMRNSVELKEFWPVQVVPGVIDVFSPAQMQAEIDAKFLANNQDRIVAYTNARVVEFNDHIRDLRQLPVEYTAGEVLINNAAVQVGRAILSVEEELTILSIDPNVELHHFADAELEVNMAQVSSILKGVFTVPLARDRKHLLALMKYFAGRKEWHTYFELKNKYPDLRQKDAATVHKVQGSSHPTIYIDAGDISTCRQPEVAARLLYVAVSRARQRVVFYGDLAEKYGGFVW